MIADTEPKEKAAQQDAPEMPPAGGTDNEPETMESLLAAQSETHEKLQKREVVWVKVIQVQKENVLVDIGEKSEGVIPASEFPQGSPPPAGKRVPAVLVKRGRGDHAAILSTEKARGQLGWEQVAKAFAAGERVRGKVTSAVKGGFLVDVFGVSGFMPSSLSDLRPVRNPKAMVGTGVRCYILEIKKVKSQLILSRRAVLEEDAKKRKAKVLETLKAGKVRIGRINRVNENGLSVDIGGLEGLVHTQDIAWKDPEGAKKRYARGQKVRVKVLSVDAKTEKVSLGIKQLSAHPADALRKKYSVKSVVRGKVTEILEGGVRIKLVKGDPAFCSIAELVSTAPPEERGGRYDKRRPRRPEPVDPTKVIWPKVGDAVSGIVTGIHPATFEVSMSIRRFESIQDRKRVARYMKGAPPLTLGQLLNPDGE